MEDVDQLCFVVQKELRQVVKEPWVTPTALKLEEEQVKIVIEGKVVWQASENDCREEKGRGDWILVNRKAKLKTKQKHKVSEETKTLEIKSTIIKQKNKRVPATPQHVDESGQRVWQLWKKDDMVVSMVVASRYLAGRESDTPAVIGKPRRASATRPCHPHEVRHLQWSLRPGVRR